MCGICGIVGSRDTLIADAVGEMSRCLERRGGGHPRDTLIADAVGEMSRCLERRGPDSHGELRSGVAMLGHRRLAIFDLSAAGHPPMITPDGRAAVGLHRAVYNLPP